MHKHFFDDVCHLNLYLSLKSLDVVTVVYFNAFWEKKHEKIFNGFYRTEEKRRKNEALKEKAFAREWVIITLQKKGDTPITDVRMSRKSSCDDALRALI
jgi:hypothetical protein